MCYNVNAYKSGLVPKAALSEQDYQAFETDEAHNLTASVFSDYSGDIGTIYDVPAQSKYVAAAVTFIRWMEEPANQAAFAGANGPADVISTFPLPSNRGGLTALVKSGKVPGAATIASLLENHSRAIFPAGAPPWYAQFSNAVYTNIHSAAAGAESVPAAISAIASTVKSLGG